MGCNVGIWESTKPGEELFLVSDAGGGEDGADETREGDDVEIAGSGACDVGIVGSRGNSSESVADGEGMGVSFRKDIDGILEGDGVTGLSTGPCVVFSVANTRI